MSLDLPRKYYLAGPMTGIDGHNFKEFDKFASGLRNLGYEVVSPAEIARSLPGLPGDLPYYEYVRADLRELMSCTDLVLLPGWRSSRGASMELKIADFVYMRVWRVEAGFGLSRMEYGDQRV